MKLWKIKMGLPAILVVFGIGCAQKVAVRRTADVPAALAEAKITKTDNNNTRSNWRCSTWRRRRIWCRKNRFTSSGHRRRRGGPSIWDR